ELTADAEAVARVKGTSVNGLIIESLTAAIEPSGPTRSSLLAPRNCSNATGMSIDAVPDHGRIRLRRISNGLLGRTAPSRHYVRVRAAREPTLAHRCCCRRACQCVGLSRDLLHRRLPPPIENRIANAVHGLNRGVESIVGVLA